MGKKCAIPFNPFEDVNPSAFNKLNKKHVTEDFVEENFKNLGWEVYKPFNDTGIDRIIIKNVCPKGHTDITENLKSQCPICNEESIQIIRFIQIKTRELKKQIFGFTLKSKDIRIDPRHVYLLYSDKTTEDRQDFFIVPVKDFLEFVSKNNLNVFSSTSFRKGNNKLNSLKYHENEDCWKWSGYLWEKFRNCLGLKNLQDPAIDMNLDAEITKTRKISDQLQFDFSKGETYSTSLEEIIKNHLETRNQINVKKERQKAIKYLEQECDSQTFESMKKYLENVKERDTMRDEKDEN